jgi:hypothetical protein
MKCFNHSENDAVAVCKNCSKGLCKDCLTEANNGIACTSTCVEEVNQIDLLMQKSKKSHRLTSGAYYKNAYISGGFGLVFIIYGLLSNGITGFLVTMGIIFIIGSIFSIISGNKFKKDL